MDASEVQTWFASYVAEFTALGRGDTQDLGRLLDYYAAPLWFSADAGSVALTTETQIRAAVQRQIGDLRVAGYDRSQELAAGEPSILNGSCAVYTTAFSRHRADGSEINRVKVTYLITEGASGHRFSAIVIHAQP